jgi:predicted nucleic acid-binding Zn ribbon protein
MINPPHSWCIIKEMYVRPSDKTCSEFSKMSKISEEVISDWKRLVYVRDHSTL